MTDRALTVGLGSRSYNYSRTSYGLPVPAARFEKGVYLPWKFLKQDPQLENTYVFLPERKFDLYHLWNGVLLNRRPYVTSFESYLPRVFDDRGGWLHEKSLRSLQSDNCHRLLAMSDFARRFFLWQNDGVLDASVADKLEVFYGGVEIPERTLEQRAEAPGPERTGRFRCCFIGHEFFRKGGMGVVRAFERLAREHPHVELVIVSRLLADDYASHEPQNRADEVAAQLRASPWVEWHETLPHADVLELMRSCQLGLLPTLDDTFGWSVLEAMSHGLPVVGTNVCALPEIIIDGHNGFQIALDLAPNGRWVGFGLPRGSAEAREAIQNAYQRIDDGLVDIVGRLCQDPARLEALGRNAVEHVRERHDPVTQGRRLGDIYREVVG